MGFSVKFNGETRKGEGGGVVGTRSDEREHTLVLMGNRVLGLRGELASPRDSEVTGDGPGLSLISHLIPICSDGLFPVSTTHLAFRFNVLSYHPLLSKGKRSFSNLNLAIRTVRPERGGTRQGCGDGEIGEERVEQAGTTWCH